MEIADAFIVNKADRDGGETFANSLQKLMHYNHIEVPVLKTIATRQTGITELVNFLKLTPKIQNHKKLFLLTEKVYRLVQYKRMLGLKKDKLRQLIDQAYRKNDFNVYRFADELMNS
jgi:LAO/AO transport system kinase